MRIIFEGDGELRKKVREVAESNEQVLVSDQKGITGAQALQMVVEYGPPALVFIKALIEAIEAANKLRKQWKLSVESDET